MPALEWGWKPDFRAPDLLPWISGNLCGLSLSHWDFWGCRGWAPGTDGCPWLWHHGFRYSGSGTQCPLIQRCTTNLLWGGRSAGRDSLTFMEGLLDTRSKGRDGFPHLHRAMFPFQVILGDVSSAQPGWLEMLAHTGAAGQEKPVWIPLLCW